MAIRLPLCVLNQDAFPPHFGPHTHQPEDDPNHADDDEFWVLSCSPMCEQAVLAALAALPDLFEIEVQEDDDVVVDGELVDDEDDGMSITIPIALSMTVPVTIEHPPQPPPGPRRTQIQRAKDGTIIGVETIPLEAAQ